MRTKKYCLCFLCIILLLSMPVRAKAATSVNEKVTQVVNQVITSGMSQLDKASALHDWLTDNSYYDLTFKYYGPEGVLLHGTGVCQSYSEAYKLLLAEAGIESYVLTGHARKIDGSLESHAWNLVKIDGKWKHVDVTWDDPVDESGSGNVPLSGLENHMFFMVSTSVILTDHMPDEESAALIDKLVGNEIEEELPKPVVTKALAEIPDFSFKMKNGTVLTKDGYGKGKKLMIVYGRTVCLNTTAFLSNISGYISQLKNNGVTVLAALYDNPSDAEIKEMESRFPGVVCARVADTDNSMWEALYELNKTDGSVIFPVVILKNAKNAITYCSIGYVDEPLKLVAGALNMNGDSAPNTTSTTEITSGSNTSNVTSGEKKTAAKAKQPMTVKAKKLKAVKASKLKKNNIKIKKTTAFTIKKNKGKLTFKKISGNKKIIISKAGTITLKKGLKKGTYKLKVKVTAAGTKKYKSGSRKTTVTIIVK